MTPGELVTALGDGDEIALLDGRERDEYVAGHLFWAVSVPLLQLGELAPALVPRRTTRVVWCCGGDEAAAAMRRAGWTDVDVLDGEWPGEIYSGANVPSKAFGELVEAHYGTPHVTASEVEAWRQAGKDMIVVDSRPVDEYRRMSIPGGIDVPGAELVHRVPDLVTGDETTVVVNCAGRTRSILGAQSLRSAGLANPVVALENGTMGWELAGFDLNHGAEDIAGQPSAEARSWATSAAEEVADRHGIAAVMPDQLPHDDARTTFVLDVRTAEEYEVGHIAGSRHSPGGQLVQATDEYIGVRNAKVVLVDDDGVRATMTASWLIQLGWSETFTCELGDADLVASSSPVVKRHWPKPYDTQDPAAARQRMRDYIRWEVGLVEQVSRDPTATFSLPM